jgi:hypothetical protein
MRVCEIVSALVATQRDEDSGLAEVVFGGEADCCALRHGADRRSEWEESRGGREENRGKGRKGRQNRGQSLGAKPKAKSKTKSKSGPLQKVAPTTPYNGAYKWGGRANGRGVG